MKKANKIPPASTEERREQKYYGINCCRAVWKSRPQDIFKVYLADDLLKEFSGLLKWCAEKKIAYQIVTREQLEKITSSVHHEGICLLAKEKDGLSLENLLGFLSQTDQKKICVLCLEDVDNPHNVGAIIRTAAHFGVTHLVLREKNLSLLSGAASRIAEGGAEKIKIIRTADLAEVLTAIKNLGFTLVTTSSHQGSSIYKYKFKPKTLILLGNEIQGVSPELLSRCNKMYDMVSIPGTNAVESLNVSTACGIILGEYWRQIRSKK